MNIELIQKVYNYFKSIPHDKWLVDKLFDKHDNRCALGHLVQSSDDEIRYFSSKLTSEYDICIIGINNTGSLDYSTNKEKYLSKKIIYEEFHPKDRVLHFLKDLMTGAYIQGVTKSQKNVANVDKTLVEV